jgi:hypothetical protein
MEMKELAVNHIDPRYIQAVMADREREIRKLQLARAAKQARSEKRKAQGRRRRWRISLREPLKA